MSACPHCSENIDNLPGFVTQSALEDRLKGLKEGKNAEILALSNEVTQLRTKATSYDAVALELGTLKTANTAREKRDTRTGLFSEAKVDAALLENFEQVYSWSQNGAADGDQKSFEDWFATDAKTHVLLAPHFNGSAVVTPPAAPSTDGSGINTLPPTPTNAHTPPPPSNGKMTNEDLDAIFESAAFQALNSADKRAKIAQLKQGVNA